MSSSPEEYIVPSNLPSWEELNRRVNELSLIIQAKLRGWCSSDAPDNDWIPSESGQWIGNETNPVEGVAVGEVATDPTKLHGALSHRSDVNGGGVLVMGVDLADVSDPSDLTELANRPATIAGTVVHIYGSLILNTGQNPIGDTHYLLIGESTQMPDGTYAAPVELGPIYIPAQEDVATDARDVDVDTLVGVSIVTVTLTNNYIAGATVFYAVNLDERSSRSSTFTIEFYHNGVYSTEVTQAVSNGDVYKEGSFTTQTPMNSGDTIEIRVWTTTHHNQSTPFVTGSAVNKESVIGIRQG